MNILKNYFCQLATRHVDILHSSDEIHFCDLGDESDTSADHVLHYPCVLYSEEPEEDFTGMTGSLRRPFSVMVMILDHTEDTSDYPEIKSIHEHMDGIAEDFLRRAWRDHASIITGQIKITHVENKDAALYGAALSFAIEVPFCMTEVNNHFVEGEEEDDIVPYAY